MTDHTVDPLAEADAAWRAAFEQAWEAYTAGSPPVGAVVVDRDGTVIARGRSRRGERAAPPNQLAGSRLAHAEINALAQLGVHQHDGLELRVTLEPCLLCWAAIRIAHIPVVRFAGADPMWSFLSELAETQPAMADRPCQQYGPLLDPLGAWAALLPLIDRLRREPSGVRMDHYRGAVPALVDLAQRLVSDGTADRLGDLALPDAVALVWTDLVAAWKNDQS